MKGTNIIVFLVSMLVLSNVLQVSAASNLTSETDYKETNSPPNLGSDYFWMDFNSSSDPHNIDGGRFESGESWTTDHDEWEIQGGVAFDDTPTHPCGWSDESGVYSAVRPDQDLSDNTIPKGAWSSCAKETGGFFPSQNEDSRGWATVEKSFDLSDYVDTSLPNFTFSNAFFNCDYKVYSNDFNDDRSHIYFCIYLNDGTTDWPIAYEQYTGADDAPNETNGGYCIDYFDPSQSAPHGENPNYFYNNYENNETTVSVDGQGGQTVAPLAWLFNTHGTSYTLKFKIFVRCYGEGGLSKNEQYQFWVDDVQILCFYEYNSAPDTPYTPSGPTYLKTNEIGEFCTYISDEDNDQMQYRFDFDADGSHHYTDWSELCPSDTTVCVEHFWDVPDSYKVKAQVKDEHGMESVWSDGLVVDVVVNQAPSVDITAPGSDEIVFGIITISGVASDSDGFVTYVEVKIDDSDWYIVSGTSSWEIMWDTTYSDEGQHTIYAQSFDGQDYSSQDFVDVFVNNINDPPNTPSVDGPEYGRVKKPIEFSVFAIDADRDDVYYYVDWGDGTYDDWAGPYASGQEVKVSHTYKRIGKYDIAVKAKDIEDAESNLATSTISIRLRRSVDVLPLDILSRFLGRFPLLEKIMALCH